MLYNDLHEQLTRDLSGLCAGSHRHPGSANNRQATEYVSRRLAEAGCDVTITPLDCLDWESGEIVLRVGKENIPAFIGPYSESCQLSGPFQCAATREELAAIEASGQLLVLHGDLCQEQLAAKGFVFYNPEHHQEIIALLEQKNPRAVIAITGCNPSTTGALSPFPLIEDGDFAIPSAYVSERDGTRILAHPDEMIYLSMDSRRIPSQAFNVVAVKPGVISERIVFCAHIDSKKSTPGAIDNAGGVCILLALAALLQDYQGKYTIELLAINGEDYYAYPGGMRYLADNAGQMEQIRLVVNCDGVGARASRTSYCYFNAGDQIISALESVFHDPARYLPTEPWYQSDHAMFAMQGVPAAALTTEAFQQVWATIAHTEKDTVDQVDVGILAGVAVSLRELIDTLNQFL